MRLNGVKDGEGNLGVRSLLWFLRRRLGQVPVPLRIYAYRPSILWSFQHLVRVVRRNGALPQRLKGLAMYWTARTVECEF